MNAQRSATLTAAGLVMATGATLALLPPGVVPSDLGTGIGDKSTHAGFAGLVAGLLVAGSARRLAVAGAAFALVVGLSGLLEAVQPLTGRSAELADWFANATGAACVLGAWLATGTAGALARSLTAARAGSSRARACRDAAPRSPGSAR
jgi:VanZ family protein